MSLPEEWKFSIVSLAMELYLSGEVAGRTYAECVQEVLDGYDVLK